MQFWYIAYIVLQKWLKLLGNNDNLFMSLD